MSYKLYKRFSELVVYNRHKWRHDSNDSCTRISRIAGRLTILGSYYAVVDWTNLPDRKGSISSSLLSQLHFPFALVQLLLVEFPNLFETFCCAQWKLLEFQFSWNHDNEDRCSSSESMCRETHGMCIRLIAKRYRNPLRSFEATSPFPDDKVNALIAVTSMRVNSQLIGHLRVYRRQVYAEHIWSTTSTPPFVKL